MTFYVWVSRRFWPWPKRYKCKGVLWVASEGNGAAERVLLLILHDEGRVLVDLAGRIIRYAPEFLAVLAQENEKLARQKLPIERTN